MGNPLRTNKPSSLSHPIKVLGDQGTDHRVTGWILPEGKVGESPTDGGARKCATSATHAGRQAGRETSIGITHEAVRRCRPTLR
jgi:hypothetical protein